MRSTASGAAAARRVSQYHTKSAKKRQEVRRSKKKCEEVKRCGGTSTHPRQAPNVADARREPRDPVHVTRFRNLQEAQEVTAASRSWLEGLDI